MRDGCNVRSRESIYAQLGIPPDNEDALARAQEPQPRERQVERDSNLTDSEWPAGESLSKLM